MQLHTLIWVGAKSVDLKLSVLIPTKNRSQFVLSAIQSALSLNGDGLEVIVSENYSSDDSLDQIKLIHDSRLKLVRPSKPLAMHENFEFLLSMAKGEWITFIGDDDAIMPHALDYLKYLDSKYLNIEAIYSPRSYYLWESSLYYKSPSSCFLEVTDREVIRDSKKQLQRCLEGKINYFHLPQIYSGGFHKRSLVLRVIQMQNGVYFRSVTPDAYSAVMGVTHTYRYLEVGIPMVWVGSSPSSSYDGKLNNTKDRHNDFIGATIDSSIKLNYSLGDIKSWPLSIHFLEAYLASPFADVSFLSVRHLKKIINSDSLRYLSLGDLKTLRSVTKELGVSTWLSTILCNNTIILRKFYRLIAFSFESCSRLLGTNNFRVKRVFSFLTGKLYYSYHSSSGNIPTILHANNAVSPIINSIINR